MLHKTLIESSRVWNAEDDTNKRNRDKGKEWPFEKYQIAAGVRQFPFTHLNCKDPLCVRLSSVFLSVPNSRNYVVELPDT